MPLDRWRYRLENALSPSVLGALDSLGTSGTMFVVQMAIILTASKSEYGLYSLVMSYVLVGQSIFSAFFGPPLITALSRLPGESQADAAMVAMSWQFRAAISLAVAFGIGAAFFWPGRSVTLTTAAALAFVGLTYRDAQRTAWTANLSMEKAFLNTCLFAGLVVVGAGLAVLYMKELGAAQSLAVVAGAVFVSNAPRIWRVVRKRAVMPRGFGRYYRSLILWSAPGVIVIWIQNNLYLTIVALYLNLSAVGEISAGRMLAVPYLLASTGLLRVAQVRFTQMLQNEDGGSALRMMRNWVVGNIGSGLALSVVLIALDRAAANSVSPTRYPHLLELAAYWFLFAGIATARGAVSSMFQAIGRYKAIFLANICAIPTVLGGIVLMVPAIGLPGAVLPMAAAEAQLLITLALILRLRPPTSREVHGTHRLDEIDASVGTEQITLPFSEGR